MSDHMSLNAQLAKVSMMNTINSTVADYLKTGHPVRDALLMFAVMSLQEFATEQLTKLARMLLASPERIFHIVRRILAAIRQFLGRHIRVLAAPVSATKVAVVDLITSDHDVNTLYDAVDWYLNEHAVKSEHNRIDYQQTKSLPGVAAVIPRNVTAKVLYENIAISYTIESFDITVHADKDYIRTQHRITMTATGAAEVVDDQFMQRFVEHCSARYNETRAAAKFEPKIYHHGAKISAKELWTAEPLLISRNLATVITNRNAQGVSATDFILARINEFRENKDWYLENEISYTLGFLLVGPPGTGKTSICRGTAKLLGRHIHYVSLKDVESDEHLRKLFSGIKFSETIVVIEDIDLAGNVALDDATTASITAASIKTASPPNGPSDNGAGVGFAAAASATATANATVSAAEEIVKAAAAIAAQNRRGVSMSGLVNVLDGINGANGRILFMSTNHPERLDPTLTRAGRVDYRVLLGRCTHSQTCELFDRFYKGELAAMQKMRPHFFVYGSLSGAEITGIVKEHMRDAAAAWNAMVDKAIEYQEKKKAGLVPSYSTDSELAGITDSDLLDYELRS